MESEDLTQLHQISVMEKPWEELGHLPRTASLGEIQIQEHAVKAQADPDGMRSRVSWQGGKTAPGIVPDLCSIFITLELESFNHTSRVVAGSIQLKW